MPRSSRSPRRRRVQHHPWLQKSHEKPDRSLIWRSGEDAKPFTNRVFLIDLPREGELANAARDGSGRWP